MAASCQRPGLAPGLVVGLGLEACGCDARRLLGIRTVAATKLRAMHFLVSRNSGIVVCAHRSAPRKLSTPSVRSHF